MVTRALLLLAVPVVVACGDAKTASTTKAEVELPAKRDVPAKVVADEKAIAKADANVDAKADGDAKPTPGEAGAPDPTDAKVDVASGGAAIGVAECDSYIAKYNKCIDDGVPADMKQLMREAVEHSREAWKKAAAGSEKGDLPAICKGALAAAKQATAKYGCVW